MTGVGGRGWAQIGSHAYNFFATQNLPNLNLNLVYNKYIVYNVYMYTIAEFRKNMRQAFEDSNQGHEVVIERYNQKYQLVSLVNKPLPGHSFESVPKVAPKVAPKIIKTKQDAEKVIESKGWSGPISKSFSARKKK